MEFPDDVWTYIMEYLPKPVKKYPYIKELNNIITNRDLFFEIYEPNYYDEYANVREDYPETFYECYRESRINKLDLDYHSRMLCHIYTEPDSDSE
jgi:hypothetical protein